MGKLAKLFVINETLNKHCRVSVDSYLLKHTTLYTQHERKDKYNSDFMGRTDPLDLEFNLDHYLRSSSESVVLILIQQSE